MRAMLLAVFSLVACTAIAKAPPAGPAKAPCLLTVKVPVGATMIVNGAPTAQMTEVRKFISPSLEAGKAYYYTFTIFYQENLQIVTKKKQVQVKAGDDVSVDFADVEAVKVPNPEKKEENMFVAPKGK
jgi:uncharacterized protein (TIGR03000 family)